MANPSNLYAEKIYSEHPLFLWALDDQADYISLISEEERDISTQWSISEGTASEETIGNEPFKESITTKITGTPPVGATNEIILISPDLVNFDTLNSNFGTFCIGSYFYSNSAYLESISIGFEYTDTTTSLIVDEFKTFNTDLFQRWGFISETFNIPNESADLRIVIKIKTISGSINAGDYEFYLNGVTAGQWSEEFNTKSLGIETQTFPLNIALNLTDKVVPAAAYGVSTDNGYYIVNKNSLTAKNCGVPIVFGSSNITKITPNNVGDPSLIIPGKGFLNEIGRYKNYTVEFWAKINSNTTLPKKFFGPITGPSGLYVEGGFLTLVIDDLSSSHFVGYWNRPMLIHIRLVENSATVLLNGEQVISINLNRAEVNLPSEKNGLQSQDWLAFYAYEDVTPIEIDCIAIYSYQVPTVVAKRRWVYGQGVGSSEIINSVSNGESAFIDYAFADYTANYKYPSFAKWEQGSFDNLETSEKYLTVPTYRLPEIFLSSKTLKNLYDDCKVVQTGYDESEPESHKFITFRPNNQWISDQCYVNFSKFNVLNDEVSSVYAIFSTEDTESQSGPVQPQSLLKIYNLLTGDYFLVKQEENLVKYVLNYNNIDEEIYVTPFIEAGQLFAVGFNIKALSDSFGQNVSSFFNNRNSLGLYVGGNEQPEETFTGKIYSLGFSTELNTLEINNYFNSNGIVIFDDLSESGVLEEENAIGLINHIASYTLVPSELYEKFFLDINVSGYWEDYIPLSYFGQYVNSSSGSEFYDLDFLQFNIDYPEPQDLVENEVTAESWTYQDLKNNYDLPIQKTYEQLDDVFYSGWSNYEDMSQRSEKFYEYDTSNSSVRSYLTFQYISEGANASKSYFTNIENARNNGIVDIDEHPLWNTTKFEVLNDTIIYPTKTIDFNQLAIVTHLEFKVKNSLTKPVKIKNLELTSQAFNDNSFNPVGTSSGLNIFPYKRSGLYYDYKFKNPFSIYKESTPYLYLTQKSGIRLRGDFEQNIDRGLSIPINRQKSSDFKISASQLWMLYENDQFSIIPTKLFEIDYKEDVIEFYVVANGDNRTRGRVYAKSKETGLNFNEISYFWNGTLVREPVITAKEWGVLGLAFLKALNLNSYIGKINLNGPVLFNNVAYYKATNLQEVQSSITRPWLNVKTNNGIDFEWIDWFNSYTWEGVLVIATSELYSTDPSIIYKSYIGTNKIIIDDEEGLIFDAEKVKIYNNIIWQGSVQIPV